MNIQTRSLPASPFRVLTPGYKQDIKAFALSATIFPIATSLLTQVKYKEIFDLPPIAHLFTIPYLLALSAFEIGSGLLLAFSPLLFISRSWGQVARELPTEELIPYLNRASQLEEEELPRLRALIDGVAGEARFDECMERVERVARLPIWLLLSREKREEASPRTFLLVAQSFSSLQSLIAFLCSLTEEQRVQFGLLIADLQPPQVEDPTPPVPHSEPAAAAA